MSDQFYVVVLPEIHLTTLRVKATDKVSALRNAVNGTGPVMWLSSSRARVLTEQEAKDLGVDGAWEVS